MLPSQQPTFKVFHRAMVTLLLGYTFNKYALPALLTVTRATSNVDEWRTIGWWAMGVALCW